MKKKKAAGFLRNIVELAGRNCGRAPVYASGGAQRQLMPAKTYVKQTSRSDAEATGLALRNNVFAGTTIAEHLPAAQNVKIPLSLDLTV